MIDIELEQELSPSDPGQPSSSWSFDEINQQAVLTLVDAHLRVRLRTQMGPVEDQLRAEIVDIVRRCQSAVAASFQSHQEPSSGGADLSHQPLDTQNVDAPLVTEASPQNPGVRAETAASISPSFLQEPPFVDFEDIGLVQASRQLEATQVQNKDSGYESQSGRCDCSCHTVTGSGSANLGI